MDLFRWCNCFCDCYNGVWIMTIFKETLRKYDADQVDQEIKILTQSRDFWRNKALDLQKEIDKRFGK